MRAILVEFLHPLASIETLGRLPEILWSDDPRPVKEQLEDRYAHGGGYRPVGTGDWYFNEDTFALEYPGDPIYMPLAMLKFPKSGEIAILYDPGSFLLIKEPDSKKFVVVRVD